MKRAFGIEATAAVDLALKTRKEVSQLREDLLPVDANARCSSQDEYEYVMQEEERPLSFYDVNDDDVILIKRTSDLRLE